ncbi:glycosyltransferase family A protein [Olsenella sp. DNF00959]|uniref:glycosyltransferase family A protein n=1 Tax=Olsenella sp. DNF00959 TaxID=1476999 RepID=UPI00078612A2|nr:glycosyltransferase family A protein [Olsenella sp. DNF00959]
MLTSDDHSFAVLAYGESPYLAECVESLLAQTVRTRVFVSTSTPNEHIRSVARRYGLELRANEAEPGIASDWNFAVSQSQTPLLTLAHQDDTYEPGYAEHMLGGMAAVERPLIFFTNYGELREGRKVDDNRLLRVKRRLLSPIGWSGSADDLRTKRRVLSLGSAICCPSVTLNLPLLPNPPFRADMRSNLDWDAWERFSRLEGSFVYDREVLMHHRIHEGSETSALIRDNTRTEEDLRMLERFWPTPVARAINLVYSRAQASNSKA